MTLGTLVPLTASIGQIDTSDNLAMVAAFQKCFISNGAKLKVADFINKKIFTTSIAAAVTPPAIPNPIPHNGDILTDSTTQGQMVVDYITSTSGNCYVYGYITTSGATDFISGHTVTYYVNNDSTTSQQSFVLSNPTSPAETIPVSSPHWYTWTAYAATNQPTTLTYAYPYGKLPPKAYLICLYQGRLVLAGNPETPHQWYMSRAGNPWDWAFLTTDSLSPVAGANGIAGVVGDIITALAPYQDDYLIFGGSHTIHVARGDPAAGGSINCINETTGIFGATSWCWDNNGNFYFLGNNGICKIPRGLGGVENLTQQTIPNLVKDLQLNSSVHRVTMIYDREQYGILIAKTTLSTGANSNYWYDLRTNGFFPEVYPDVCGIYSGCFYDSIGVTYRRMVVGCTDGFIRFFDTTCKGDVITADSVSTPSSAIASHLTMGPLRISKDEDEQGNLASLTYVSGGDVTASESSKSGPVTYEVYPANSAEEVISHVKTATTPLYTGVFPAIVTDGVYRKPRIRTRARGVYLAVRLKNTTANETFSVEKVVGEVKSAGKVQSR